MIALPRPSKVFYGWWIVLAGAATNCLVLGLTAFGFGVLIEHYRLEYGWSVKAIALGISLRSLEQGVLAPFTGYFVDRVGPRKISLIGTVLISISFFIFSRADTLPLYYAASLVMSLGSNLGGFGATSLAVMRWFVRKRGRAMGMLNVGNGFGYLGPLVFTGLIAASGFQSALAILGVAILLLGIPLAMVIRDSPASMGLLPDGDKQYPSDGNQGNAARAEARAAGGMEVREVLRTPAFYLLIFANATGNLGQGMLATFHVPHLHASGFSITEAAVLVAVYGLGMQIPMRVGAGWLSDVIGRRKGYVLSLLFQSIGLVFFALLSRERLWAFPLFYLIFGMGHALSATAGQALVADYFGTKRFATIRGLSGSMLLPLSLVVPIFVGSMFDSRGNYRLAFITLAGLSATSLIWAGLIRRPMWIDAPTKSSERNHESGGNRNGPGKV